MPKMQGLDLEDTEKRLRQYLVNRPNYGEPEFVDSGGSAAIYKVNTPDGFRAIKAYNPVFLSGEGAASEKRRLNLQRALIGHDCKNLIKMHAVVEAEGTAFIEMDYVEWPQLKKVIEDIPDDKISDLIKQLVTAVRYLEKMEIVHRDIKPENIHVSPDFSSLLLIDLGVARELTNSSEEDGNSTDHGLKRPFISTAQYSSPEYLFRLDAPSPEMWKGLNIYQVGAVAHDLINKRPLFQAEVDIGNRWIVARAVLTQTPSFPDAKPERLASLKSIASRCLVKDLATRLNIVDWSDFNFGIDPDPLERLQKRLANFGEVIGGQAAITNEARIKFDRDEYFKRLSENVRTELIPICGNKAPFSLKRCDEKEVHRCVCEFTLNSGDSLQVYIEARWPSEIDPNSSNINIEGQLHIKNEKKTITKNKTICVGTINVAEEIAASDVAKSIAINLLAAIEMIEVGG